MKSLRRDGAVEPVPPPHPIDERRNAAIARMGEMFPLGRGLKPIFSLMVSAHRRAIDYIEQAPVIVLGATHGNPHLPLHELAAVRELLGSLCESGAQLRDVMRAYDLPLPLRVLDARVLTSSRAMVIRRLARMNPSSLAQIIPATGPKQNAWLEALQNWCDGQDWCAGMDSRCLFFEWAATNYSGISYGEARFDVRHMVDFVCAHADTFNPRWDLNRALVEERKWHAELAAAGVGGALDREVDYAPLPSTWEHRGLRFVALQTGEALHVEGAAMHHCVATYLRRVIKGESRIYSIRESGNRVATLELAGPNHRAGNPGRRFEVRQLVGASNARTTSEISRAVSLFVDEVRSRVSSSPWDPVG
jgi:hypothetical protein